MIPKETLHSLAQKFRARARGFKLKAKSFADSEDYYRAAVSTARAETFDECAHEVEKLKK